jgi:hypothetical protein
MKNKVGKALSADHLHVHACRQQRQAAETVEGSSLLVIVTSTDEKQVWLVNLSADF